MVERIKLTNGQVSFAATRLLWQSVLMSEAFSVVEEVSQNQPQMNQQKRSGLDEVIELINTLKQGWATLNSEQLVTNLEHASKQEDPVFAEANLSAQPELWLLKALALEKSFTASIAEVEKYYSKCRGGIFQAVLVLNNCGVVQAKRQKCSEALELFKDAMICSYAMNKLAKAPFYNFVLVIRHLYRQRLIFQPGYLAILEEVIDSLPFLAELREATLDSAGDTAKLALNDAEIRNTYIAIAEFAHRIAESPENEFYEARLSYLVPQLDLLGSFGDIPDKVDRERASEAFKEGRALFRQKRYGESIGTFEIASRMASEYSTGVTEEIEKVSDSWRYDLNKTILKMVQEKDFDGAIKKLQDLPDHRLARQNDLGLIESIQKRKHLSWLHDVDELVGQGNRNEAKLKYKLLLREELSDYLRKHVSSKLAELLKSDEPALSKDKQD